jgi:hypothetical protein
MWRLQLAAAALAAAAMGRAARAEGPTLPKGRAALSLTLQAGLSKGQGVAPLSLAPDAWVGASDIVQIGMVTSLQGRTGFWSGAIAGVQGSGACLSGKPDANEIAGCSDLAEAGGAEVVSANRSSGAFQSAVAAGFYMFDADPSVFQFKLGPRLRLLFDRVSIGLAPSWFFGDHLAFSVPVEVGVHLGDRVILGAQSGLAAATHDDRWSSAWPVAASALFFLSPTLVVAGAVSLDRVAGFEGPGALERRSASLMVGTML